MSANNRADGTFHSCWPQSFSGSASICNERAAFTESEKIANYYRGTKAARQENKRTDGGALTDGIFAYENIKKGNKIRRGKANLQTKILKFSTKSMAPGPSPHTKRPHTCSYYLFRVFLFRLMRPLLFVFFLFFVLLLLLLPLLLVPDLQKKNPVSVSRHGTAMAGHGHGRARPWPAVAGTEH